MTPILFVDSHQSLDAAERSLLLLMQHLDSERFRSILACNESPLAEEAREAGIDVQIVPMPRLQDVSAVLGALVHASGTLAEIVREHDVAIVHSNTMRANVYALIAARRTGRPFVWHVHEIHERGWYVRLLCALADRVIAVSQAASSPIHCGEKANVIHNGLVLEDFEPARDRNGLRSEFGLPLDVPVIGSIGRSGPSKRQDLFLRAAARVRQQHPDACYAVVGETVFPMGHDQLGKLRAQALELDLLDHVVFPSFRSNVADLLSTFNVVVHTAEAEPFGRILIEAMAMGQPVIAFAEGGVPEIVVDGETGLLVEPGDIEGMADAVVALLHDPDRRREMGAAGRRRVEAHFDVRQTVRVVEAVYDDILACT